MTDSTKCKSIVPYYWKEDYIEHIFDFMTQELGK